MSHTRVVLIRNTQPVRLLRPTKTVVLKRVAGGPAGQGVDLLGAKGDLLTHDGVIAVVLPVGTDGQYLKADSATSEGIVWDTVDAGDLPVGIPDASVDAGDLALEGVSTEFVRRDHQHAVSTGGLTATINAGDTAAEGSSTNLAREDHQHPVATAIAGIIQPDDSAAEGVSTSLARADHTHGFTTATPDALAVGAVAAEGTALTMVRADHTHGVPAAAPGATINAGDLAVEGVAITFVRSDHQHAVATGTPGTIQPDDLAAEGVSTGLARADHTHAIVAATAVELTDSTNAEGVAASFARSDHTHAHGSRGGGALHAVATAVLSGFMSAADKSKLDGIEAGATADQTLAEAYAFGSAPADSRLDLDATRGPLVLRDNATPIGDVLVLEDSGGDDFFNVDPTEMNFGDVAQRLFRAENLIGGYGRIEAYPDDFTRTIENLPDSFIVCDSTITSTVPGGGGIGNERGPNFVTWQPEVIITEQGNLFNMQSLFNQASVFTMQGANGGPVYTMINQPLLRTGSTGGARTTSQQNAVRSQLRVGPNVAGTHTVISHEPYFATMIIDASGGAASVTAARYFAPKAPTLTGGATVGTLHLADFPNIPAAGITNLRGIFSEMDSGEFVRHEGTAPMQLGGSFELGVGSTFDWSISRGAANRADIAAGDSLRISTTGQLQFGTDVVLEHGGAGVLRASGTTALDIDFDGTASVVEMSVSTGVGLKISPTGAADAASSIVLGDGLDPNGAGNWWLGWSPGARTVPGPGDWFDILFNAGANVDVNGEALGTLATCQFQEPGITLSGGSVVTACTVLIANAPTEGSTNNNALRVGSGLTSLDDLETRSGSLVGFYGATPVGQSAAYTRNAVVVEDRTLLASASATTVNNNNVLAALIADLQAIGILA